jgi:hypothetical protein
MLVESRELLKALEGQLHSGLGLALGETSWREAAAPSDFRGPAGNNGPDHRSAWPGRPTKAALGLGPTLPWERWPCDP